MKTKIYGTIGPACQDTDTLVRLFEKGMTGIRINLSHSNLRDAENWIKNIHEAYRKYGEQKKINVSMPGAGELEALNEMQESKPLNEMQESETLNEMQELEILMDLQGPELRIGKLSASRMVKEGDGITLLPEGQNNLFDPTEIPVPELIMPYLTPGQEVLLDDGKILLQTEELFRTNTGYAAECKVVRGGEIKSKKSIALPGAELYPPTLTKQDLENIHDAKKYGITGVMLPFVRNQQDLKNLRQALIDEKVENIQIFAKIENMDGVNQLPELLDDCDEIVIARGDLGNAMPLWELPVVQAHIAKICRENGKPFMVVTQMLASMEQAAVPTRAEVSDIFRAVSEGAASVMLTGETAAGKHPVEAMKYMVNTVRNAKQWML